jgi:hypothetical protein
MSYTNSYQAISKHYAGKTAQKSGLPYMNHIDEGMRILDRIFQTQVVDAHGDILRGAWCIHPMVQEDSALTDKNTRALLVGVESSVLIHAMEYRAMANSYLSYHRIDQPIYESPLPGITELLLVDKIQNYKDLWNHNPEHERFGELVQYFNRWFYWLKPAWSTTSTWHNTLRELTEMILKPGEVMPEFSHSMLYGIDMRKWPKPKDSIETMIQTGIPDDQGWAIVSKGQTQRKNPLRHNPNNVMPDQIKTISEGVDYKNFFGNKGT